MKISPVGADIFHADRPMDGLTDCQTDMKKLTVTFHNFEKLPKNM
jgi:hypothetical protein